MHRIQIGLMLTACLCFGPLAAADQSGQRPNTDLQGPTLQFDWPTIQVGVGTYEEGPTGLTIIRFMQRAAVVEDSRGGAPGTVNTDMLRLGYDAPRMDAIVFSGSYLARIPNVEWLSFLAYGVQSNSNVATVGGALAQCSAGRDHSRRRSRFAGANEKGFQYAGGRLGMGKNFRVDSPIAPVADRCRRHHHLQ